MVLTADNHLVGNWLFLFALDRTRSYYTINDDYVKKFCSINLIRIKSMKCIPSYLCVFQLKVFI